MNTLAPRYTKKEFAERGQALYEKIQQQLTPQMRGSFVAIDIESGGFAVDEDDYEATELLLAQYPDAQIWLERVGESTAYRLGGR